MKSKWKDYIAVAILALLLPYVCTVFVGGISVEDQTKNSRNKTVTISQNGGYKSVDETTYLIGALAAAISPAYEPETLKAQSIILRTWLSLQKNPRSLTLEEMQDVWSIGKFQEYYAILKDAVESTEGEMIYYEGKPILAPYHAISAGQTRDGNSLSKEQYPYLKPVACHQDVEAPEFLTMKEFTIEEMDQLLGKSGIQVSKTAKSDSNKYVKAFSIESKDSAGYVEDVKIFEKKMTGEAARDMLGLPSSNFTVEEYKGNIRIVTKGLGHGLGMSQYYANKMAEEGKNYKDILHYFYTNIEIKQK